MAIGAAAFAGCSSTDTKTGPSTLKCQVGLTLSQSSMGSAGGPGTVTVATQPECAWTASSEAPWITGVTPTTGQGNGEVKFDVAANPNAATREGTLVLNDIRARVTQTGATACSIAISPAGQDFPAAGGNGAVSVNAGNGCTWGAASNAAWLVINSGHSGSGNGSVTFTVNANAGGARTAVIVVGGQTFAVTQQAVGVPACSFAIQPGSVSIGAGASTSPVSVTAGTGCAWTSTSQASWLTFSGASSGSGNGTVTVSAAANTGASRTGTVTIAGQTFSVTQQAFSGPTCSFAIQPSSVSIGAGASTTPVDVTAGAGCAWTSTSQASWLTFNGASSGSGNVTVTVSAAANTGASRTGTVTIAGQTFTVNQATACTFVINPASQNMPVSGGNSAPITVTAPAGCSWTSVPSATWITITAGATGTGNGVVTFSAAANPGSPRTATITIGGQDHTVTQGSSCSYSLSSTSLSLGKNQSTGRTVNLTTTSLCTWTATSNDSWLTITSGASGTGNGTVRFDVARNDTGSDRTGTLTIANLTFTVNQDK